MRCADCQTEPASPSAGGVCRRSTEPWQHCAAVSILVLAFAAQELPWRSTHLRASAAAWAAPVVAVPIAAKPQVAHPTKSLGDCDFRQRFLIANEVSLKRCHLVAISLLGGLYGP